MRMENNEVSTRQVSDELSIKLEALPVEIIGLSTRATRLLQKSGVRDCKTALDVIADNFDGYAGIGEKTIISSKGIAADFIELVDNTSIEKLESLVEKREIYFSAEEANLVESFPGIVELFISKEVSNPERGIDIINRRFNLNLAGKYSLEDIGTYYDITRERVRQLEAKILKDLKSLLDGSLETKNWILDKSVFEQYRKIEERLKSLGNFLSLEKVESEFLGEFDACLGKGYLSLFLRLSGFIECPTKIDGFRGQIRYGWCTPEFFVKKRLEVVFSSLDYIFGGPEKVLLFDLIVSVKKDCRRSWPNLSNECLKTAIEMCEEFELEDNLVYVGFHFLRSASDKAFRILEASGKPVHFSAIAREINLLGKDEPDFQPVKEMNLRNQMIVDSKFSPIGRSGLWGLSEWTNIHTGTIIEAMEKAFHLSGRPMLYQELKSEVLKIRPDASDSSLRVYLDSSPLFSRIDTATWALKTWKIPAAKQKPTKSRVRISNSQLHVAVKESFPQTYQMTVPELIHNISENTGLAAITVRQKIRKLDFLSIQKRAGT